MSPATLPPHYDEAKIRGFIGVWKEATSEGSTAQTFFRELCRLLGVDEPPQGAPVEAYRFEKRVPIPHGTGLRVHRADVYRQDMFVWENKSFERTRSGTRPTRWVEWMRLAYEQAKRYGKFLADESPALRRPPLIVVCDIGRDIWIWNNFTSPEYGTFEDRQEFLVEDLVRPKVFESLRWALSDPQRLNPYRQSGQVTIAIAKSLGRLVGRLEARIGQNQDALINESIARFIMACIFTLFAEDMRLLPDRSFRENLHGRWQDYPQRFVSEVRSRWKLMDSGGEDPDAGRVLRFNGGLFHKAPVLALTREEIHELAEAARYDWSEVEPSIFGTLLEQSLRSHERARLGAYFTPREYIERIVQPTIMEPLRSEWQIVQAEAIALAREANLARERDDSREARNLLRRARNRCSAFLGQLRTIHVLDPACGTGNFLYVAMDLLKRLEKEVLVALRDLGEKTGQLTAVLVQPDQFFGIEKKAWSKEIAELVLWIGYLQWWKHERGHAHPPEPVLRPYGNIEVGDALLGYDDESDSLDAKGRKILVTRQGKSGKTAKAVLRKYTGVRQSTWPDVDFIVSNPPFIGNKRMRELLGDGYAEALRKVYQRTPTDAFGVPNDVDYVAYWWHKAAMRLRSPSSRLRRFGFITTNSIRQRQSGAVLRQHLRSDVVLQFACPDHPWIDPSEELGSAAVRISMTVARRASEPGATESRFLEDVDSKRARRTGSSREDRLGKTSDFDSSVRLHETRGQRINADLTIGADLTVAIPLLGNSDLCFQGMNLVGDGFRLPPEEATKLIGKRRKFPRVLRRYIKGHDLKEAPVERFVIDFFGLDEAEAQKASPVLFNHLAQSVRPLREANGRENYRRLWWLFGEARPGLRKAISGLSRYIATPETSRHRFFVMLEADVIPDHQIYVIATEDYYILGILSSTAHTLWALRAGGSNGVGNDSRWNSTVTFLPFPFPDPSQAQRLKIAKLAERLDVTRRQVLEAYEDASLTSIYNLVELMRSQHIGASSSPVSPDDVRRAKLWRCDTLLALHQELDRAVFDAYGFESGIDDEEILVQLLLRNQNLAANESADKIQWLRPEYQLTNWKKRATASRTSSQADTPSASSAQEQPMLWPTGKDQDSVRTQVTMIRKVLAVAGRPLTLEEVVARIQKPRGSRLLPVVRRHLQVLEAVGVFTRMNTDAGEFWSLGD